MFFDHPTDVGNLISGSSPFSKTSLNIWKFLVYVLLKPSLENAEHYFASMMESYFDNNNELKLVLILLDARREVSADDQEIIDFVKESNYPYAVVITKIDKVNQKEKSALNKRLKEQKFAPECVFYTSSLDNEGLNQLKKGIEKNL